jgi:energy-coupling factor transporter ATP-binding protein EcfA2
MRHLIIRNIGPIKEAEIELKRFNFIIGPQSSGKSTIAKILSTCSWVEKEVATTMDEHAVANVGAFRALMEEFHKMKDYFDENAEILYETEVIRIYLKGDIFDVKLKNQEQYHREKICYIPSERNSVTLPELQGFEFGQTNLRSFLFDWFNAREFYGKDNKTDILNLGVRYFYDPNEQKYKDRIEHINGKTYQIPLSSASSGLQSVVPLQIMLQYYSSQYFETFANKTSFDSDAKIRMIQARVIDKYVLSTLYPGFNPDDRRRLIAEVNDRIHRVDPEARRLLNLYQKESDRLTVPVRTSYIVEEPEQNLYPFTQIDLLEAIVYLCSVDKQHKCTITTHSPFILNYLNVLIERYNRGLNDRVNINPDELGVFSTNDGRLIDIMQVNAKTGEKSVNAEDLVEAMRYMHQEYREIKKK